MLFNLLFFFFGIWIVVLIQNTLGLAHKIPDYGVYEKQKTSLLIASWHSLESIVVYVWQLLKSTPF